MCFNDLKCALCVFDVLNVSSQAGQYCTLCLWFLPSPEPWSKIWSKTWPTNLIKNLAKNFVQQIDRKLFENHMKNLKKTLPEP